MVNYQWIGAASTSASNTANWNPNGTPAAGDVVIFDGGATQGCSWDIIIPPTALSVDEIILENDFEYSLTLAQQVRIKGLYLGATIATGGGSDLILFEHGASPNFFGSYKTYNERFILIDGGTATGIDMRLTGSSSPVTKFDDGQHPNVELLTGSFAPDYVAPTGTSGKTSFDSFTLTSPATFSPDGNLVDNDRLKVFSFTTFSITSTSIDFGLATAEFYATSGGFYIPTAGADGMPSDFVAYYRKIVLKGNTAGHKCLMSDNTYISVEEFEIDDGVVLKGPVDDDSQGADIRSIKTPKLRGTWSFSQIAPGIYRSPRHASGPMPKVNGDFYVTGKLTVDGLIDPTGMVFTPQATNPESTNPQDTIWIDSETNHLFRGERDTESTVHFNVRNDEGAIIPLGAPLYSKGEIGGSNRIKVGIADASDPNKMPAIGLAMEEMNTTSTKDGNMILTGLFNDNITITGVTEQDIIYVAPHGGSAPYLTITRPTSPSHLVQNVGVCVRQSATNVSQGMKVAAIGRTNDSPNSSFLMVNTESTHPQARRLVAGTNITLTDGGAGGDLTIAASGGGTYTDAQAIAAVEGEATLDLTGDVSLAANKELTINESTYSSSSKNSDDTKVLVSADSTGTNDALFRVDTDAGFLRMGPQNTGYCHFYTDRNAFYFNRNIEMDGGSFQAYNDDLQIITTTTSGDATRIFIDAGVDECRVGIGNGFSASSLPEHALHVKGEGNFAFRVQADEGNLRMNRFGHLQIQNDNNSPLDGETIDSPLWQIGQRDGGQLDIAFGALSTQLVAASDALLTLQRGSATGPKQIGFLGASPTAAIDDGAGSPLTPITPALVTPSVNESTLAARLDAILAGLQQLGLFA